MQKACRRAAIVSIRKYTHQSPRGRRRYVFADDDDENSGGDDGESVVVVNGK